MQEHECALGDLQQFCDPIRSTWSRISKECFKSPLGRILRVLAKLAEMEHVLNGTIMKFISHVVALQ